MLSRLCAEGRVEEEDGGSHFTYPSISPELPEVAFMYFDVEVEYSYRIR